MAGFEPNPLLGMETHKRFEAIDLDLNRYFTGKPCKRGHVSMRRMVGGCIECRREYERNRRRERRAENPNSHTRERAARRVANRKETIEQLTRLQRGRCAYCREKLVPGEIHVDHIQPRSKGGPNVRRNYQLACAPCNISKGAKDPILFAQQAGMLL